MYCKICKKQRGFAFRMAGKCKVEMVCCECGTPIKPKSKKTYKK